VAVKTVSADGALRGLALLQGLLAVGAVDGGVGLIVGTPGFVMPVDWLVPAPWGRSVVLGCLLVVLAGGALGCGAVLAWFENRRAPVAALVSGLVLAGWVAVQLVVLGMRVPIEGATVACAAILLWLAAVLRHDSVGPC
jgi:hypothetical protein